MGAPVLFGITFDTTAPPDRVWAVMSDVEHWHEWTASVKSIRRLDSGPLAPGSRAIIRQPKFPPASWIVTDVQPRSFTWTTKSPGMLITAHHAVEARGGGSFVTLSLKMEGPLAGIWARLTRGITERYLGLEAAGLKKRSEQAV